MVYIIALMIVELHGMQEMELQFNSLGLRLVLNIKKAILNSQFGVFQVILSLL